MDRFGVVSMLDRVLQAGTGYPAGCFIQIPPFAINIVNIVVYPAAIGDQFETQYIIRLENPFFEGIEAYLVSIGLFRLKGGIDARVADL